MSRTKTIGTIFASLAVGAVAFLVSTPKKNTKNKTAKVEEPKEERTDDQNLFI